MSMSIPWPGQHTAPLPGMPTASNPRLASSGGPHKDLTPVSTSPVAKSQSLDDVAAGFAADENCETGDDLATEFPAAVAHRVTHSAGRPYPEFSSHVGAERLPTRAKTSHGGYDTLRGLWASGPTHVFDDTSDIAPWVVFHYDTGLHG